MPDRGWMTSDEVGVVYVFRKTGHGPSKYMCIEHTGDNHYAYREVVECGFTSVELGRHFSMYGGGNPKCTWQPTNREFHLLMAGKRVRV